VVVGAEQRLAVKSNDIKYILTNFAEAILFGFIDFFIDIKDL
jgi:hypothetical protein